MKYLFKYNTFNESIKEEDDLDYRNSVDKDDSFLDDDYQDDRNFQDEIMGYGKLITLWKLESIAPTLQGLIRDNVPFDFYYYKDPDSPHTDYLIELKGDWRDKIKNNLLPSIDGIGDQWYISRLTSNDWYGVDWIKVADVEMFIDAKKYNL